jgi:hypothetical protein
MKCRGTRHERTCAAEPDSGLRDGEDGRHDWRRVRQAVARQIVARIPATNTKYSKNMAEEHLRMVR